MEQPKLENLVSDWFKRHRFHLVWAGLVAGLIFGHDTWVSTTIIVGVLIFFFLVVMIGGPSGPYSKR